MIEDLTTYSDGELSMRVFNIENLYIIRHRHPLLMSVLKSLFKYSLKQKIELMKDLKEDHLEILEFNKNN